MVTFNEADSPGLNNGPSVWSVVKTILAPVASLKLTVALLGMSVFLVLAGTLAQTEKDIWPVVGQYFRCWWAQVDFSIFFPKAWFPKASDTLLYSVLVNGFHHFWFPGGFTLGALMGLNLLTAHSLRFTVQAKGARLVSGLAVLLAGIAVTYLVIASNDNTNGLQGVSPIAWKYLWGGLKTLLGLAALGGFYLFFTLEARRMVERMLLLGISLVLSVATLFLLVRNDISLGDSSMRILWQLIQGMIAGGVLLGGCALLFRKRAGVVLLHGGIALMMANELIVYTQHEEAMMLLREGETQNYVEDIRAPELAIIDRSHPEHDRVVVIPAARLEQKGVIQHQDLPFDVVPVEFYKNAAVRPVTSKDKNPATHGIGRKEFLEERRAGTGTDADSAVDMPAAYVTFRKKGSDTVLGTHAVALDHSRRQITRDFQVSPPTPERVKVDGKTYDVFLRFKRIYKPYSVTLVDVRSDKYLGTETAKNYSSDVLLNDPSRNVVDRPIKIWMNNPLRFAGDTFYQSQVKAEPHAGKIVEVTGLQVVKNTGWMVPYVACMIVGVGMLAHFVIVLARFLDRQERTVPKAVAGEPVFEPASIKGKKGQPEPVPTPMLAATTPTKWGLLETLFPAALVTVMATYLAVQLQTPDKTKEGFRLYDFGRIPVVYQGRVKPLDTVARNALRVVSNRESFYDSNGKEQPAIRWLADLMAETQEFRRHRVIKIDNPEVLATLKLKRREHFLYSLEEVLGDDGKNIDEFNRQADEARKLDSHDLEPYQRKLLETDRRFRSITLLQFAFNEPRLPDFPTREQMTENREQAMQQARFFIDMLTRFREGAPRAMQNMQVPLSVPTKEKDPSGDTHWEPFSIAYAEAILPAILESKSPARPVELWAEMHSRFRMGDGTKFNTAVAEYRKLLAAEKPTQVDLKKVDFESFFNNALPFYWGGVCYVFAFVLAVASWLGWRGPLSRAAFWMIMFTLCIHTAGLIARIYISGRPPVTNLYSSAVFISWGCVSLGLILEWLFGKSIGNIVASVTGFSGLVIGHFLSADGDTFVVLQAVLDTQFWLATHVVTISLGYSTTFLAGFLGLLHILLCVVRPAAFSALNLKVDAEEVSVLRKQLGAMMHGVLCFAIFFSFVGTVLGGLWADDSWGRFWGWDPKENGALIIVLWNALVLHARWDKLVGDRGLAVLVLGGNICTMWSWFGVNELGVGLHSYGFKEGTLRALGVAVAAHLVMMGVGLLPKRLWAMKSAAA